MSTMYTLHELPDGTGVVVCKHEDGGYAGEAGFTAEDVNEARQADSPYLYDWCHLSITPEAAAFVASTYPIVVTG